MKIKQIKMGGQVYLQPEASFAVVQKLARTIGESIPLGPETLARRMNEAGLLIRGQSRLDHLTVRRVLEEKRRDVLALRRGSLMSQRPDQPDHATNADEPMVVHRNPIPLMSVFTDARPDTSDLELH